MGELTVNAPGDAVRRADRLADLYRAESANAVRLAYLLTGQRQLAEDLAQEAFLRVASRLRESDAELSRQANEASGTTDTEMRAQLWDALQALPTRQREAIVCRFYLDMSEEQTAECSTCASAR